MQAPLSLTSSQQDLAGAQIGTKRSMTDREAFSRVAGEREILMSDNIDLPVVQTILPVAIGDQEIMIGKEDGSALTQILEVHSIVDHVARIFDPPGQISTSPRALERFRNKPLWKSKGTSVGSILRGMKRFPHCAEEFLMPSFKFYPSHVNRRDEVKWEPWMVYMLLVLTQQYTHASTLLLLGLIDKETARCASLELLTRAWPAYGSVMSCQAYNNQILPPASGTITISKRAQPDKWGRIFKEIQERMTSLEIQQITLTVQGSEQKNFQLLIKTRGNDQPKLQFKTQVDDVAADQSSLVMYSLNSLSLRIALMNKARELERETNLHLVKEEGNNDMEEDQDVSETRMKV